MIYPDTTFVTNGYDGPGNLTSVTDQAGNTVQYTFDPANQLQSVVQVNSPNSSNNTTAYGYDKDGNLTNLTYANGHSTVNAYELLYNLTTTTLPDGSLTETPSYDMAGNLLSLQHFNGKTTTYAYDPLNRLLTRTPDSSYSEPTISFNLHGYRQARQHDRRKRRHDEYLRQFGSSHSKGPARGGAQLHLRCGKQCSLHGLVECQRRLGCLHLRQPQPAQHGGRQPDRVRAEHDNLHLRRSEQPSHCVVSKQLAVHLPLRCVEPPDRTDNSELGLLVPAWANGESNECHRVDWPLIKLELRRHLPANQRSDQPGPRK